MQKIVDSLEAKQVNEVSTLRDYLHERLYEDEARPNKLQAKKCLKILEKLIALVKEKSLQSGKKEDIILLSRLTSFDYKGLTAL